MAKELGILFHLLHNLPVTQYRYTCSHILMKALYYLRHLLFSCAPKCYFNWSAAQLRKKYQAYDDYITSRVNYYVKVKEPFDLLDRGTTARDYTRNGHSAYYFDLKEFLYFFPNTYRFTYHFGDETHVEPTPTLFKARPIDGENHNSVLFKLNKRRHFRFIHDPLSYSEKKDQAVFRGRVTQEHRVRFMNAVFSHHRVDAGQSNPSDQHPEWQRPFMSVEEQLQYKFLICLEGNDVASNLKWAMSSNSVVVTPKMKYETWFMEGTLKPGVHYIEVKDDWSDFDEKIEYYLANPEEAQKIVKNAHAYIQPFQNEELEKLVCIKTLERYFELSGQLDKKAD